MNKNWKKIDKASQHVTVLKTDDFNRILKSANAKVKVVRRDDDLHESYLVYLNNVDDLEPVSKEEFEKKFYFGSCVFRYSDKCNRSATYLMAKALGVKKVSVKWAKDDYGKWLNDSVEVTYTVA